MQIIHISNNFLSGMFKEEYIVVSCIC